MNENILVTGSSGFIGSHFVALLDERDQEFSEFDMKNDYNENIVTNSGLLEEVIEKEHIGVVVHLAAQPSPWNGELSPFRDAELNILGTLNVLRACKRVGVNLVYASTGAVYGNIIGRVDEYMPTVPVSHYGVSKKAGEMYVDLYRRQYDLTATIVRFSSVYGPGGRSPVNIFCRKAIYGEKMIVYGDGSVTRDYTHVSDVAKGVRLAAMGKLPWGDIFNIASGTETSIRQLLDIISTYVESGVVEYEMPRKGDIPRNYFDISRARIHGYEPMVNIEQGVEETLNAYKAERDSRDS